MNRFLSWPGAKFRQMDEILKYIDINKNNIICEPYLGTGAFSLNFLSNSCHFIWAEKNVYLYNWWKHLLNTPDIFVQRMAYFREYYNKAKEDRNIYNNMRDHFNKISISDPENIDSSALLWVLVYQSTNNLARFNKKGEYNQTWGKGRKIPDPNIVFNNKILQYLRNLKDRTFLYNSAEKAMEKIINSINIVVYLDPPYFLRTEVYDKDWSLESEKILFNNLDILDANNIPWFMTNYLSIQKDNQIIHHPFMDLINQRDWSLIPLNRKLDARPTSSGNKAYEYIIVGNNKNILK